jgi:hypothetical protein
MKWIAPALFLAFALRTAGQTPSTHTPNGDTSLLPTAQSNLPTKLPGIAIERWHYDPAQKAVILHLVNQSHKDVTAFNISIAEKYADGSTDHTDGSLSDIHDHQMMEDMLGLIINIQMGVLHQGGNGTFAAGTNRDYVDGVGKDVSDIDAIVDVVAYADGSADVLNNERAFRNLMAERRGRLLAMEKVNDVIERVLGDAMVSDPVSATLNELLPFTESLDAKTKNASPEVAENNVARNLQGDIQNLQRMQQEKMSGTAQRESLAEYVDYQEKRIALMKPHCELAIAAK